MCFLTKLSGGNQLFYSKLTLIINLVLLIETIFLIVLISLLLINLEIYIQIYLLLCLFYYLLSILYIIISLYFNIEKTLFNNKIFFTILSSYILLTINIILISLLFGDLFYIQKEEYKKIIYQKQYKNYILIISITKILNLFTLVINILIFHSFKFFQERNINNNLDKESYDSKSTDEDNKTFSFLYSESFNDKIYFQENMLDKLYYSTIDSFTQTI